MAKITISEAVDLTGVSESTIRRDIKSGKVSSEKDPQGRRRIDVSELTRAYGQLKPHNGVPEQSNESVRDSHLTKPDTPKIVALLENHWKAKSSDSVYVHTVTSSWNSNG